MFGTGGIQEVGPDRTIIESLIKRGIRTLGYNVNIKSIVQTKHTTGVSALHVADYKPDYFAVNANKQRVDGPTDPTIPVEQIQLNHYFCRDQRYLNEVKVPRREAIGVGTEELLKWESDMTPSNDLLSRYASDWDYPINLTM